MRIDLGIERALDRPIVRQLHFAPLGICKSGLFRARGFAFEESPAVVETEAPFASDLYGGSSRADTGSERQGQ
jgi:hypothetical protein